MISANLQNGIDFNNGTLASLVQGNLIGLGADGTTAVGNGFSGISISKFSKSHVQIGGAIDPRTKRDIGGIRGPGSSSGGDFITVEGNYIGTDVTGMLARPNLEGVVSTGRHTVIGGPTATPGTGPGNVISANGLGHSDPSADTYGILLDSPDGGIVQGNIVGLKADLARYHPITACRFMAGSGSKARSRSWPTAGRGLATET